ncbi:DNA-binding SARP family transcriptional activator [Streptomyces puniciscabiei]|uniref:DNA-binding SARP family transcriptional activator n=1 Tax=Streptomyces puniciscabiei TaxID=164348 RepID=A0A542UJW0_9ACTN|nr:bacterial transcriptional activator domain-containing protein [Streptomyces puniciscabiei]TQK99350.1 DNA-binding SARP family transcriptional activator [Streptomyces puniciscabiei]
MLPLGTQRLLALLALNREGVYRAAGAGVLWPDSTPCRAAANLRSALCQARRACSIPAIECIGQRLRLSEGVLVDLRTAWATARQIIAGLSELPYDFEPLVEELSRELLPGWPDEWLTTERDRWNQLRQHALESLAQQFRSAGHYVPALQTALAAIGIDPIRETGHRIVIDVHAAEGNLACAVKRYEEYRALLRRELGVAPSAQMTQLIRDLVSA